MFDERFNIVKESLGEYFKEILEMYKDELILVKDNLEKDLCNKKIVHSLKSSSGSLGSIEVFTECDKYINGENHILIDVIQDCIKLIETDTLLNIG